MVLFNYSTKELTAKVVYYGPGLCGKTTNLQYIHANLPGSVKGKMLSLATKTDRTLFFDFLPLDLGTIRGMKTRIQLYTVPGQVFYNETRKLVLKGADGIVFVADSQEQMLQANVESFRNLEENLKAHGMTLAEMPHVLQFNKRDLPRIAGLEEMNAAINKYNAPFYESVATTGIGVQDTLKAITKLVLLHLTKKYDPKTGARQATTNPPASVTPAVAATASTPVTPRAPMAAVPLSGLDAARVAAEPPAEATPVRTSPPPPPNFHGPADDEPIAPTFGDDEIADLMDEVGEIEAPAMAAAAPSAPTGADVDDGPVLAPFPMPSEDDGTEPADDRLGWSAGDSTDEDATAGGQDHPPVSDWAPVAEGEDLAVELVDDESPALEPIPMDHEFERDLEPSVPLAASPADASPEFEIDDGFDRAPTATGGGSGAGLSTTVATAAPPAPFEVEGPEGDADALAADLGDEPDDAPIELTEVADDRSLFDDPTLDVARLAAGQAKEIVVPVELGDGPDVRRFKLSVTLRLDPVE